MQAVCLTLTWRPASGSDGTKDNEGNDNPATLNLSFSAHPSPL